MIRGVTVAWLLILIFGSLQPVRPTRMPSPGRHAGLHWVAFSGAALLLLLVSSSRRRKIGSGVLLCLLGLALEYLQHVLYHIGIEWPDVRNDCLAVLATFTLYRLFSRIPAGRFLF
jgi:ABC-type Fe3+-siderophore transport system permease subunit